MTRYIPDFLKNDKPLVEQPPQRKGRPRMHGDPPLKRESKFASLIAAEYGDTKPTWGDAAKKADPPRRR